MWVSKQTQDKYNFDKNYKIFDVFMKVAFH